MLTDHDDRQGHRPAYEGYDVIGDLHMPKHQTPFRLALFQLAHLEQFQLPPPSSLVTHRLPRLRIYHSPCLRYTQQKLTPKPHATATPPAVYVAGVHQSQGDQSSSAQRAKQSRIAGRSARKRLGLSTSAPGHSFPRFFLASAFRH